MADFLTEKRQEIDNRLKELRPLYDEYLKLEKAQAALAGMDQGQRRGPGRPRGSSPARPRAPRATAAAGAAAAAAAGPTAPSRSCARTPA